MKLNTQSVQGLENIRKFIVSAENVSLVTVYEAQALNSLAWRLQQSLEACLTIGTAGSDPRFLPVDVAMGMQVSLEMSCDVIRYRASLAQKDTEKALETTVEAIAAQEEICRVAKKKIKELEEILRDTSQITKILSEVSSVRPL